MAPSIQPAPEPASNRGEEQNVRDQTIPLLISAPAAADILGISKRTLWSLTNRNAVPSKRIGRSVRYCPAELRAWITAGCPTESGAAAKLRKGVNDAR